MRARCKTIEMADDENGKKGGCPGEDRLIIGPQLPDGSYTYVRHTEDHAIEGGAFRQHPAGEPLGDDSFRLIPRGDGQYAVRPAVDNPAKGPAKVATKAYREGWDSIFGKRMPVGEA